MDPVTLNELFFTAVDTFRQQSLFLFKKDGHWQGRTAPDVDMRVRELALGLSALGVKAGERVAILSENRPEWVESDLAILSARAVTVPIYPTLPGDQAEFILANSDAKVLIVPNADVAARIRRPKVPKVQHVVLFDGGPAEGARTLAEVMTQGRDVSAHEPYRHRAEAQKARPEDLATVIYTSGTTGNPKGVMLTHGNIASNVASCIRAIPINNEDLALSFLPLSHIFERMMTFALLRQGASIAYAEALDKVPQNLTEVRPTIVAGVPRFYEKIHERIMSTVRAAKPARQRLFESALDVGRERSQAEIQGRPISRTLLWKWRIASMTVFRKIREAVGGRVRLFISGGAPLSKEIGEFFHACGLTILEGYGLTETSPVITVNRVDDLKFGTVGKPVANVDVRIAEDGEILARGPNVMTGYWNLPKDTKEALRDGWFHTGDVGHFDPQGFLVITDRKKELIKTSGGKFVAPQPLEAALKASPWVSTAVVVGDKRKFCIALLVPRFEAVEKFAHEHGLAFSNRRDMLAFPAVRKLFDAELEKVNAGRAQHETVKKVALLERELSMAEGELTPTLKVKRRVVEDHFKEPIEALYKEDAPPPAPGPA
ncbi:MAG: long-chain fatty acid--CoA ligase [Planctomycetes bacterium]|nr:long-chain fatty acid--CoA ligase [Planctomycetota bacterium]